MTKICVVNVSNGNWYPLGQRRLVKTLRGVGKYTGDFLLWADDYPKGCPTHRQIPYAFKTYALREARSRGYDIAIWLDSSMVALRDLKLIFDQLNEHGYWLPVEPQRVGQWSTDACLKKLDMDRETAFSINTIMCGCVGFDFRSEAANFFLDKWHEAANDGVSFHGPHNNSNNDASKDPRVFGHRHDIPAASIIAYKNDYNVYRWAGVIVPEYGQGTIYDESIFLCKRSCSSEETL